VSNANTITSVIIQIEHIDAIENIDEILSVSGIDGVFIGPYDLSASMGIPGQFNHPDMLDAIEEVEASSREYDVKLGTHIVNPDISEAVSAIEDGYTIVAYSLDITVLSSLYQDHIKEIRSNVE
jgi:2-dehydro-3-deoxyglucarate aldolase